MTGWKTIGNIGSQWHFRVVKRAQHVAPNNVRRCCVQILRSFGRPERSNAGQTQCWDILCWNVAIVWPGLCVLNDEENIVGKLWKMFSRMRKSGFKKSFPALPPRKFYMFISLINNYSVFLVQFGIWAYLNLWVFQKVEIALEEEKLSRAN